MLSWSEEINIDEEMTGFLDQREISRVSFDEEKKWKIEVDAVFYSDFPFGSEDCYFH
jgi:hypothetical protein